MLTLEQALERLLAGIHPLSAEDVPLIAAAGRFLAEPIASPGALPPFDNSAMDGWAVRSADVAAASVENPICVRAIAKTPAGETYSGEVATGQCVRIFTGSPLPRGADAVVMQEDARLGLDAETTAILDPVKAWENVRFRGEDVKPGAALAQVGDQLTPELLALLSACGIANIRAYRVPTVAILATGNELREPALGAELKPGEIFESNRVMIAALVRQLGAEPIVLPIVPDDLEATKAALREAASRADAIITCGGVSVGEYDFVKSAIQALDGQIDFWRVAMKPGKPFLCALLLGKPLFGLPGNPVSALVTFTMLARPALLRMAGSRDTAPTVSWGILAEEFANPGDRRHFVRVVLDAAGNIRASGPQASHRLGSLAKANALLELPAGENWPAGKMARVILL
jgi:molybdopterin molybdotransferase